MPSLQTSRYQSQQIVNSFNLFIDSGKADIVGDGRSKGDDYQLHLAEHSVAAEDGEIIRLSLVNFEMFNNVYMVNLNNCKFRLTTNGGTGGILPVECSLPRKNYKTIGAIAQAFAETLQAPLLAAAQAEGSTATEVVVDSVKPDLNTALNATDDRLIDITLETHDGSGAVAHGFSAGEVLVQCFGQVGDSFALLGGKRIDSTASGNNTTESSFKITVDTNTVRIQGYFPAQRMTDPNVYVRVGNTQNGLESIVLSDPVGDTSTGRYVGESLNSNILAKIHRDVEFISFETGSSDEYFVNLQQRRLSTLRIFLTDARGRPLGRPIHSTSGTASGLEDANGDVESDEQSTIGNLFFSATIKCEIIKVRDPHMLQSTPPAPPMPARETQSVLTWQDYGRPKH